MSIKHPIPNGHTRWNTTFPIPTPLSAEKKIKEAMHYFALSQKNEWYEVDLGIAKARLDETLED